MLGAFAYIIIALLIIHHIIQVFCFLKNKHPQLLMVMEAHVLSAAIKLSHGEDLRMTISCLHEGIKASKDVLTHDLQAFNWFDLSIFTDILNCQPSQSLPAAEINYLLPNKIKNLVGLENAGGLTSPPCTPKGFFPSASTIPQSPCINPQILEFGQLRVNEDIPMVEGNLLQAETQMQPEQDGAPRKHEEQTVQLDDLDGCNEDSRRQVCKEDSDGRNGESRGENMEDKDAMGVKEVQEEEDHEEKGQEEKQEYEWQEEQEQEQEDQQQQEQDKQGQDKKEKYVAGSDPEEEQGEQLDVEESDAVKEDAVEEDAVEEDAVEEDAVEEDAVEENAVEEDLAEENVAEICRSAHL